MKAKIIKTDDRKKLKKRVGKKEDNSCVVCLHVNGKAGHAGACEYMSDHIDAAELGIDEACRTDELIGVQGLYFYLKITAGFCIKAAKSQDFSFEKDLKHAKAVQWNTGITRMNTDFQAVRI